MLARRGLDEKNGAEKLNIMKSMNRALLERERALLVEAAERLAGQGGPETQVLDEDEQYIIIDGVKLKRAPG